MSAVEALQSNINISICNKTTNIYFEIYFAVRKNVELKKKKKLNYIFMCPQFIDFRKKLDGINCEKGMNQYAQKKWNFLQ